MEDVSDRVQSLRGRIAGHVDKLKGMSPEKDIQSNSTQTSSENLEQMPQDDKLSRADEIVIDESNPVLNLSDTKLADETLEEVLQMHKNPQRVRQFILNKNNYIYKVPYHIARFDQLQTLEMSDNYIKDIPWSIVYLTKLEVLNLSCNLITAIPKTVCYLRHLKELDISANRLSNLPTELLQLRNLKKLTITDCIHLTSPPLSECLKGLDYVFMFLYDRQKRCSLWVDSNTWLPHNDLVKSLYTLCVETILVYKVDYLEAVTIPNLVKKRLGKAEEKKQYNLSLAKCSQCKGVFTCKDTFSVHICNVKCGTVGAN